MSDDRNVVRDENHEIDTQARRIVPVLLPPSWEHREPGGRDYGIDMQIEMFEKGSATGKTLLMQIKGTSKELELKRDFIAFELKTQTLKYSELFSVPFLLAVCPVGMKPHVFYYVWLQEYISVILDVDHPAWRSNKYSTTIRIPVSNQMPGTENKLKFIAFEPMRLKGWTKFFYYQHEMQWALNDLDIALEANDDIKDKIYKAQGLLNDMLEIPGFLGESSWSGGELMRQYHMNPISKLFSMLASNDVITPELLKQAGFNGIDGVPLSEDNLMREFHKSILVNHIASSVKSLSSIMATYFNVGLSNSLFKGTGRFRF